MALRILHVFSVMDRGGAEMRTLELMRRIDRTRFEIDFCCTSGREGALAPEIRAMGGEVHPVRFGASFARRFARLLRDGRYDVVHANLLHTSGWMLQIAARCGVPVRVAQFHSSSSGRRNTPRRKAQRWILSRMIEKHATDIIAVSAATMDACWRRDWQNDARCRVVFYGIDLTPFQAPSERAALRAAFGISDAAPLYIHVGNFRTPKNHARLLEVFAGIAAVESDARLMLVGLGGNELETQAREQAARGGFAERVIFAGVRDDVPALLRAADTMIFPSLWEGLPGAVLESCAAGTPVLASALPVIQEIAPRLPMLRHLPLDAPTGDWVALARSLRAEYLALPAREAGAAHFAASAFNLEQYAAAHEQIWSRARAI